MKKCWRCGAPIARKKDKVCLDCFAELLAEEFPESAFAKAKRRMSEREQDGPLKARGSAEGEQPERRAPTSDRNSRSEIVPFEDREEGQSLVQVVDSLTERS